MPPAPLRVGIFGGSFDPPHVGHLLVAQDAMAALALDRLIVVPAGRQPLKEGHGAAPAHRLAMVRDAFAGIPRIEVDPVEIERGGLSFMVDTVRAIQGRHPGAALFLLVGADVVPSWPRWHQVEALEAMVRVVVLRRPGQGDATGDSGIGPQGAVALPTRCVEVSSTEIRERVRVGASLRGFVPEAVAADIAGFGIYRDATRVPHVGEEAARD
jgi:nicotinate-nucleotide adenylyltransferase